MATEVVLLTGIANAEPLKKYLASQAYQVVEHQAYPDHHHYTSENLEELHKLLQKPAYRAAIILTTRKDAVKLTDASLKEQTAQLPIFYVPIEVQFLAEQDKFDQLIVQHVEEFR
ncbi:tetraacyldisaccharide 4'-kinase [Pontibacter rugosus]